MATPGSDPSPASPAAVHAVVRPGERVVDRAFRGLCYAFAGLTIALMAYILWEIVGKSAPAVRDHGLGFITGRTWDASKGVFGVLPEIWGTLYSSLLALLIGGFFGIAIAIILTQDFLPPVVEIVLKNIIELLAAIPSVVYGLWGIFVVIPLIRPACNWLHASCGWIPFFSTPLNGPGMAPAALVLAIMILPTISAISRESLAAVPRKLKEAAYGMGATRWEAIFKVILPTAATGIFGALVLGLGRALGETMALAMLVGNANRLSVSLFSPANTLAALLALRFPEASEDYVPVLLYAAVVLMALTLGVNVLGEAILRRASSALGGESENK